MLSGSDKYNMFATLFTSRARRRLLHSQVADMLLRRLERERTLVLDKRLVGELGVGRRTLLRIAYDLALKERLHVMAANGGEVTFVANAEFRRFMLGRSGMTEEALDILEADEAAALLDETQFVEAIIAEPASAPAPEPAMARVVPDDDLGWFSLEVAPPRPNRGKLPPGRQSLPDRARDPWSAMEGAGLDERIF
ncbi:MAG: hypothetical protein LUE17_14680 [Planctomycetaceae bacterium]|nr:hypothetical protein [Planctomycetaceae bacterium]